MGVDESVKSLVDKDEPEQTARISDDATPAVVEIEREYEQVTADTKGKTDRSDDETNNNPAEPANGAINGSVHSPCSPRCVSPAKSAYSVANSHVTFDMKSLEKDDEEDQEKTFLPAEEEEKPRGCCRRPKNVWGWVVVVASWVVMIPIAGTLSSFGTIVGSLTEEFNATKLETGWIGSLAFSFTVGTCPFSTPLFNIYGGRKVAAFGVLSGSLSVLVTSFIPVLYLMFLTYSVMFGISANFVYNSAMSLTGQYFPFKHQALATCLASAGVSFGTLLMNPFTEYFVSLLGWRHTLRVLSGLIFVVGAICVATFRPVKTSHQKLVTKLKRTSESERDKVLEEAISSHKDLDKQAISESLQNCNESKISLAAHEIKKNVFDKRMYDCSFCTNPSFILWMLGTLFWSLSFLFPLIFLIDYMKSIGIPASSGALVMTVYGISEFVGRLISAAIADRLPFSLAYVYAISCGIGGLATLVAPQFTTLSLMFVFGICVGLNSGVLNSLMFACTMQLFGNQKGSHIWGYINVMLALGMVIGPVTAGGIYDATESYTTAFYMGGGMFILSAITMFCLPITLRYFPPKDREAKGKREKKEVSPSGMKRLAKPRNSLRTMLITQSMNRQGGKIEPKWKMEAANELKELNELHEAYEESVDKNNDNQTIQQTTENGSLLASHA